MAGAEKQFFTRSALRALYRLSHGVPRLINVICERALLGASLKKENIVTRETLIQAGREVLRDTYFKNRFAGLSRLLWAAAGVAAGMLGAWIFFVTYDVPAIKMSAMTLLPVAGKPEVQPVSQNGKGFFWWPAGLGLEQSRYAAYKGLLDKRGLYYDSSGPLTENTFCSDMELLQLHCTDRQETVRDIQALPLPSVLKLSDAAGGGLFVTLQSIRDKKALLRIGDVMDEVDISDIRSLWRGQYTTLEKATRQDSDQHKTSSSTTDRRKG